MPPSKPPRPDATLAALYKAVLASPDDDLPRLVYADRLDELGDHARAEFIRLQIHVANTKPWDEGHADALVRSTVLYDRHAEAWGRLELFRTLMRSRDISPGVFNPFVRGFPEVTWAVIETFSAAHRKALKKYPIRELVLVGGGTAAGKVGEMIREVGPRTADLKFTTSDVYEALTAGPPLPTVRKLVLSLHTYSPTWEQLAVFLASPNFPNVETIELGGSVDEERLRVFARRLQWPNVRQVSLAGLFDPVGMTALGGLCRRAGIERLVLDNVRYHDSTADVKPLFRLPARGAVRELDVEGFLFGPAEVQAFAASTLGMLDHFRLQPDDRLSPESFSALVSAPALTAVKSLDLPLATGDGLAVARLIGRNAVLQHLDWGAVDFSADTWAALANSPAAGSLRRLKLERADLSADTMKVLLAGRPWPNLAELVCGYGESDGRAVARLIDHPHFARLTHLDIDAGGHAAHLWKAVAKSKTVGRFHKLRLGAPITDAQLNAVLDNPEVCKIGRLALPSRVKIDRKTQRRYEKVFGVKITRDW